MCRFAPQTNTERAIAEIWQELLSVPQVGATDNFIALGGDSLDAIRFIARAEEAGINVSIDQLTVAATLASLAQLIDM